MLCVIVVSFLICSTPRLSLNLVELAYALSWYYKYFSYETVVEVPNCLKLPSWFQCYKHFYPLMALRTNKPEGI